jgi:hypothetical protein
MPAFLYHLLNEVVVPPSDGRLSLSVLITDDKREAMAERAAEMQGWYAQLLDLALGGQIENKTAAELLQQLAETTTDRKLPKAAAGLASQLMQLDAKLKADGFVMTHTEGNKRHPANYTIRTLASS